MKKLMIIDGSSLLFRAFFALPPLKSEPALLEALSLQPAIKAVNAREIIVFLAKCMLNLIVLE